MSSLIARALIIDRAYGAIESNSGRRKAVEAVAEVFFGNYWDEKPVPHGYITARLVNQFFGGEPKPPTPSVIARAGAEAAFSTSILVSLMVKTQPTYTIKNAKETTRI